MRGNCVVDSDDSFERSRPFRVVLGLELDYQQSKPTVSSALHKGPVDSRFCCREVGGSNPGETIPGTCFLRLLASSTVRKREFAKSDDNRRAVGGLNLRDKAQSMFRGGEG
ncbi:unnamed protein product [Laminaria digitata]